MFRNKTTRAVAVIMAWSSAAVAATGDPVSSRGPSTDAKPGSYALDTERYLQTELDWRSYYLNRFSAPREDGRSDAHVAPQPLLRNGG